MFSPFCLFLLKCAFCNPEIIEKQKVYTTDHFNILVDYAPRVPGHLIVVVKEHKPRAELLAGEEWEELSRIIPLAVKVFQKELGTDQYLILEKNGPKAYQSVPHVHFHLLPVQAQEWRDIFSEIVPKLSRDRLASEIQKYRALFSQVEKDEDLFLTTSKQSWNLE
jgi:diadenosine tetraphosphate (Ap4A) HIT family hydrolase